MKDLTKMIFTEDERGRRKRSAKRSFPIPYWEIDNKEETNKQKQLKKLGVIR